MESKMRVRRSRVTFMLAAAAIAAVGGAAAFFTLDRGAQASGPAAAAAPAATPVSVAKVEPRAATSWDEFSGRLEAVERVDVRSRVAGAVLKAHFREGALVKQGDLLITIDPEPYAAEVQRAQAQVAAAKARVALTQNELNRGRQLLDSRVVSVSELDQRTNASNEAEANLRAAEAAERSAQLNLGYTEVRAPVAGRVGKLEVTVGNLVAAGPGAPVLTTLVSVDPIYVSFAADENTVARALASIPGGDDRGDLGQIPVEITTMGRPDAPIRGRLQFVDNQVELGTGTVRMRAAVDNPDGLLMAGQFARVRLGQPKAEEVIAVSERAIGTDQDKKFVMVVDGDNKAAYREVRIGAPAEGLRIVTDGLKSGERIIVNGLQRVRPGAPVQPEEVPMNNRSAMNSTTNTNDVAAR